MLSSARCAPGGRISPREVGLWLKGRAVGRIIICGRDGPWHFGRFSPGADFTAFAKEFSRWSQILHAADADPLTSDQRDELGALERSIDQLRGWVTEADGTRRSIAQLNIDDDQIEWKER